VEAKATSMYPETLSGAGADVPLYPATLVWQQLMGETKSRINACADGVGKGVRSSRVPNVALYICHPDEQSAAGELFCCKMRQCYGLWPRHAVQNISVCDSDSSHSSSSSCLSRS